MWIADFWDDNPFKMNVSATSCSGPKSSLPAATGWASSASQPKRRAPMFLLPLPPTRIPRRHVRRLYPVLEHQIYLQYPPPETAIDKYFDANSPPSANAALSRIYLRPLHDIRRSRGDAEQRLRRPFQLYRYHPAQFGIPSRSFTSFRDAATETEHSRFYGGIHYEYSTIISHKMGTEIGALVVQRLHLKK